MALAAEQDPAGLLREDVSQRVAQDMTRIRRVTNCGIHRLDRSVKRLETGMAEAKTHLSSIETSLAGIQEPA